jgi:hypothetical protein
VVFVFKVCTLRASHCPRYYVTIEDRQAILNRQARRFLIQRVSKKRRFSMKCLAYSVILFVCANSIHFTHFLGNDFFLSLNRDFHTQIEKSIFRFWFMKIRVSWLFLNFQLDSWKDYPFVP